MGVKKKKIGAAGRFGAGYGKVKERFSEVEKKQRKRQKCIFCKTGTAKRKSNGIWECSKCGKKFTSGTYEVNTNI